MRLLSIAVIAVPMCTVSDIEPPAEPSPRAAAPTHRSLMACDTVTLASAQVARQDVPSLRYPFPFAQALPEEMRDDPILASQLDGIRLAGHCDTVSVLPISDTLPLYMLARIAIHDSAARPQHQGAGATDEVLDIVALAHRMRGSALVTLGTSQALELMALSALEHIAAPMGLDAKEALAADLDRIWTGRPPVDFDGMRWSHWNAGLAQSRACATSMVTADHAAAAAWNSADPSAAFAALPQPTPWEHTISPATKCSWGTYQVMESLWFTEGEVEAAVTALVASLGSPDGATHR